MKSRCILSSTPESQSTQLFGPFTPLRNQTLVGRQFWVHPYYALHINWHSSLSTSGSFHISISVCHFAHNQTDVCNTFLTFSFQTFMIYKIKSDTFKWFKTGFKLTGLLIDVWNMRICTYTTFVPKLQTPNVVPNIPCVMSNTRIKEVTTREVFCFEEWYCGFKLPSSWKKQNISQSSYHLACTYKLRDICTFLVLHFKSILRW